LFVFGGRFMSSFFVDDISTAENIKVITASSQYLATIGGFFVFLAAMFMTNGLLRGAGDSLIPMLLVATSLVFVRVPIAYFLSSEAFELGSRGIWWGQPIGWVAGFIMTYLYYKTGRWKNKCVIKRTDMNDVDTVRSPADC
ncbi:MAG: MATE family efflux transporter, partial [Candidatus Cloacimonetes bacterium]|nr:MATE family efflux transporter [Candidatus Cloacimonadota bacterium]